MPVCNICGGNEFIPGPGGRLSATGVPPKCKKCYSLERHRTLRQVYLQLSQDISFKEMSTLQISKDHSIDPKWFSSHELSVYDGSNSIDIQDIDREDQQYDIVICNHVLEHVENDKKALKEMIRIVSLSGFLQLSMPDPCRLKVTKDWGYPDQKKHGHYRVYGIDIRNKFKEVLPADMKLIEVVVADPVTGMESLLFFLTRHQKFVPLIKKVGIA